MRTAIFQALLLIGLVLVGYRACSAETRIDALTRAHKKAETGSEAELAPAASAETLEQLQTRVTTLEKELDQAEDDVAALEELLIANAETKDSQQEQTDERILSVIKRARGHVLDRQLQFHRANWSRRREQTLAGFVERQHLDSYQAAELQRLLDEELDAMVEILKRPDAAENPERSAADWDAELRKTDRAAERILEPGQYEAWLGGRAFERAVLFPWLPQREE